MVAAAGYINKNSQEWKTAIGTVVLMRDDNVSMVTRLNERGSLLWQATVTGWTPADVQARLLLPALEEIGGVR